MCRLFGLIAGDRAVTATFWLLDAPDSLLAQSHLMPDGAGIGVFEADGHPTVDKQPIAAWQDTEFARAAQKLTGTSFVAHVRFASSGGRTQANTHPFLQEGRLLAHNGAFGGLDHLDARLTELGAADLVHGQTDTERMFALITAEIGRNGGSVEAGLTAALSWIAQELPVLALNLVLITATDLWALRYPEVHRLYVLERPAGQARPAVVRSRRIAAHSADLDHTAAVVVASVPMDGESGWRLLEPGELVHVGPDMVPRSTFPLPPLQHPLTIADLSPAAAASQSRSTQHTG